MYFPSAILLLSTFAGLSAADYTITVHNNCPYTIWPGAYQTNFGKIQPFVQIDPQFRGTVLPAGNRWNMNIKTAAVGLRIFARTGCNNPNDYSTCAVGNCGTGLQCTDAALTQKISLAEFGAGQGSDSHLTFYDISIIQAFSVGVKIAPNVGSCATKRCGASNCPKDQAWSSPDDKNIGSPANTACANTANYEVTFCG